MRCLALCAAQRSTAMAEMVTPDDENDIMTSYFILINSGKIYVCAGRCCQHLVLVFLFPRYSISSFLLHISQFVSAFYSNSVDGGNFAFASNLFAILVVGLSPTTTVKRSKNHLHDQLWALFPAHLTTDKIHIFQSFDDTIKRKETTKQFESVADIRQAASQPVAAEATFWCKKFIRIRNKTNWDVKSLSKRINRHRNPIRLRKKTKNQTP